VFGARNQNDIIFVTSGPLLGSGFFTNVGATQRLGADLSLKGRWRKFDFRAGYGFVLATFQSNLLLPSPFNPGANENGFISVKPGDRLPLVPLNSAKVNVGYHVTDAWSAELEAIVASNAFLQGDQANLQNRFQAMSCSTPRQNIR
jgi:iron complex outermembrane recepter protein